MSDEKEYYFVKRQLWGDSEVFAVMYFWKGSEIVNHYFATIEKAQAKCDKLNHVLSIIKKAGEQNG